MRAAVTVTVSSPPYHAIRAPPIFATSLTNRTAPQSLRLGASSMVKFPLASRIVVKNLPYSTSESGFQKEFSSFGLIAEVKLASKEATRRSKGFAFIQYTCQEEALLALENMDQKMLDGRLMHVELARPANNSFRKYPIASGPPKKHAKPKRQLQDQVVLADCWY